MRLFTALLCSAAACGHSQPGSQPFDAGPDAGSSDGGTDAGMPATLPPCGAGPFFTQWPIAQSAVASVSVLGHIFPPGHTVPSDHAGMYLAATGVPLASPGALHLDQVKRQTYLVSANRQGQSDFAVSFRACAELSGLFGHLQTLAPALAALVGHDHCVTYGSPETVEVCSEQVSMDLAAGDPIGTVGGPSAMAFDFGLYDTRVTNAFINPARFSGATLHAACPWLAFTPDLRDWALAHVGYPGDLRTDEPRCGQIQVDLAGTAQGVWIDASQPQGAQNGDESIFVTLTGDEVHPSTIQTLALGPAALGSVPVGVSIQHSGRLNRAFAEGTDAAVYCYAAGGSSTGSYFVQLSPPSLFIERRSAGCPADQSTWALTGAAMRFIR